MQIEKEENNKVRTKKGVKANMLKTSPYEGGVATIVELNQRKRNSIREMNTLKTTLQFPIDQERVFNMTVNQEGKDFNFQSYRMEEGRPVAHHVNKNDSTMLSTSIRAYHNVKAQATLKVESCDRKKLTELTGWEQFKDANTSQNPSPIFKY